MAKKDSRTKVHPDGTVQHDYIEHGSDEHAAFLGLRKAIKDDQAELIIEGWTLVDVSPYGVLGWPLATKRELLAQKVSELLTLPPEMQSEDPQAENFAPTMWRPHEPGDEVEGII